MKTFNQISQSAVYRESDVSVSITVCGGSYGGGSEVLVVMDTRSGFVQPCDNRREDDGDNRVKSR